MKSERCRVVTRLLITMLLCAGQSVAQAPSMPNPILYFVGTEYLEISGKQIVRYRFDVLNKQAYPDSLFAAASDLPPCGTNNKASRTWVDVYAQDGKRLQGFCAFSKTEDLNKIWFGLESNVVPPSWIYIELTDRQTNAKYKSNLAETTQ